MAIVSIIQTASAATYYVATYGSDSNTGSATSPFATLQKAANTAVAGDTVIAKDGTYGNNGAVTGGDSSDNNYSAVVLYNSGNPSAWITFKAEHKGAAVLDCQMLCDSYINLRNSSYIVIQDFVITRGYKEGIHSNDAAHHITLRGNRIEYIANRSTSTNIGQDGMYTNPNCHDFIIDGNVFHDIGRTDASINSLDHGLYLHGSNYTVVNNIFYNIRHGWSIQMADGLNNVLVANNTFAFNNGQDGHIMLWNTQTGLTIRNNIFYQPRNYAITRYSSSVSSCAIDHNIVYGASNVMSDSSGCSIGTNQIGINPLLVNASAAPYDFHVQSGAPGIDAGMNISNATVDFDGVVRPQGASTDIGAYENGGSVPVPISISAVAVSGVTSSSATVTWTTSTPGTSYVEYGTGSYTSTTPENTSLVTAHSVTLTGLSASTLYHFRVSSRDSSGTLVQSGDSTLTTAAGSTGSGGTFVLSRASGTVSVARGSSAFNDISANLVSGNAVVTFSTPNLPPGITASFSVASCAATCGTRLTLFAAATAPRGNYTITVSGTGGGSSASTSFIVSVGGSTGGSTTDVTSGLAAQWKFSEGSGAYTYDATGNNNNGTLVNVNWASGSCGSCVVFSGNRSYISVPESSSLEMANQLTVSFWIYANSTSNVDPRVVSKAYSWDVKLNGASRRPQFSSGGKYAMLNYSVPLNTWQHVVMTFSSGSVTAYINGAPVSFAANTFTGGESLPLYSNGLNIGADSSLVSNYAGSMDDLRLYNRVLSAADVSALYSATLMSGDGGTIKGSKNARQ